MRAKDCFMARTSSSRPACVPMRTNPTGIASGNRPTSTAETQSWWPKRSRTQLAATSATKVPMHHAATAASGSRACRARITLDTTTPSTATAR